MTPQSEELRALWQSGAASGTADPQDLWLKAQQKARKFDRTIRWRDIREIAAGLFVLVFFLWLATRAGSALSRFSDIWLAAYGLWVIFFLLRYSRFSRKPSPEQSLTVYRYELLERYDRQMRLLKSAKYWYVLPFWVGMMLNAAAYLEHSGGKAGFAVMAALFTAISGGLWWLNAVVGVGYIKRQRQELAHLIGEEGVAQ